MRDYTPQQFKAKLAHYGMRWTGILGFVDIGHGRSVSIRNVRTRCWRKRLAWLLKEQDKLSAG
jgi:hypothetical protein